MMVNPLFAESWHNSLLKQVDMSRLLPSPNPFGCPWQAICKNIEVRLLHANPGSPRSNHIMFTIDKDFNFLHNALG